MSDRLFAAAGIFNLNAMQRIQHQARRAGVGGAPPIAHAKFRITPRSSSQKRMSSCTASVCTLSAACHEVVALKPIYASTFHRVVAGAHGPSPNSP